jgi:polyribonucleotide nucleotidyltransferase
MYPLGVGIETDIETGEPVEEKKQTELKKKRVKLMQESQDLINDLRGEGGAVVKEVINLLANRINQLINEDPECQAYKKTLETIKYKINIGEIIAKGQFRKI